MRSLRLALRPDLRPGDDDQRWGTAAAQAHHNGWGVKQLADAVHARSYQGAGNPVLLAIIRLEQLAADPPNQTTDRWRARLPATCPHPAAQDLGLHPNQCRACRRTAGAPE